MRSHNLDGVETFWGNGKLYVAGAGEVKTFREYNYKITSVEKSTADEYDVEKEVLVIFGDRVSRRKALKLLNDVVRKIEREMDFDDVLEST
jgi:hypothetical protein